MGRSNSPALTVALSAFLAAGCGTAATATEVPDSAPPAHDSGIDAGLCGVGSVPGCPCDVPVPGTAPHVGDIACASGKGPQVVACGQKGRDGGVVFGKSDASVWLPFFTCAGKDTCSAVTTYDEFTCENATTGVISYFAILGAPCFNEMEGACSTDQATVMECERGVWTEFATCAAHDCIQMDDHPGCASSKP